MTIFKTRAFWKKLLKYFCIIVGTMTLIYFTLIYLEEKKIYQREKALYEYNIKLFNLGMQDPQKAPIYAAQLDTASNYGGIHGIFFKGDVDYMWGNPNISNKDKALQIYLFSARKGNIYSQIYLGDYYNNKALDAIGWYNGYHADETDKENAKKEIKKQYKTSAYWYLRAAQAGNAYAQGQLGNCYRMGDGVSQNFKKAIYWIQKGAKGGNAKAQLRLGNLYESGLAYYHGWDNDYWYTGEEFLVKGGRLKSKKDDEKIVYEVFLYPNLNKAKYYWKLSAAQGNEDAQNKLEQIYE